MPNRLAISNIAWTKNEDDSVYFLMQKYGFTGLEIAPSRTWDNPYEQTIASININEFREKLQTYDLNVVAFQSLLFNKPDLTIFIDEETRQATLEHLKKNIVLASKLGAAALVFGSPKNRLVGDKDAQTIKEISLDFFGKLGNFSVENGVYFCMEPNPTIYGTDFICTTEEAIRFIREVNNPGLKLNIDLGTITANSEDIETILPQAIHYAGHFHISEPYLEKINLDQKKHERIREILTKEGYTGTISIEMKAPEETIRMQTIEETLKFVSAIYGSPRNK